MTSVGNPKQEYKDVSDNVRHCANMRFAQTTIFIAITGGLFFLLFGNQSGLKPAAQTFFKWAGILVTFLFWVMEERAIEHWAYYCKRAISLENILGYEQYKNRPARKWFTARNAARGLYCGTMLMWLATFIWPTCFWAKDHS
jgi:hypothetical protein